ncbi:M20 family peptidase [Haloferax mediterranei ATCC 33500]|uniref:Acetylornithine deacetylase n=1 Tax=Haloferax mediterranei (strain ATCC 33500 / DSM 1411 / JCM 8866 / NBRC 14739 / NCIMB 2177 / R-4) TaxID=523841 RepID=I3R1L1_HALMT|nr:M20/M25/M40 family metallo-hydrolase [Haloferax mediterranei]AFK18121.1 acetylornithine deacetylase [Haloferax mediterranei ATCC 33500]AHZ22472.1 peptidase M20 [Haloferax mediterranei ATCC 33500]EMA02606.1 acetylornithine deacetylase [Haloferax mediterranei ATCC 33500]MDX5988211.1 M20/M25/M40 family metallo-hydrolase [Haloferax mediterranei ATCC 33500]QCQ74653.1 M20 family peptidase [Haloferax mediterranei ATCC 33500]
MDELTALTSDLVSVPSHQDETAVGDFIETWLRDETDSSVIRDENGNVVARTNSGVGESLALVGHHDVVPPADRQVRDTGDYVVERRDGRLYGRGAADMKGAVAAAMLAFRDAVDSATSEVVFASFVGEEVGGTGVRAALDSGLELDYAVVAEGSTNYSGADRTDVAVAHRGRRASTLVATGTACHASEPEQGENAVYRACDAVDVVRDLSVPAAEVLGHAVSGSATVTGIDGGSAWNVIPDRCEITIDERTVPGGYADFSEVESVEGVEWVVEQDLPPMACDDAEFADHVLDAARQVHEARGDEDPQQVTKPHATDAGWLAQEGTTCVVYGPSEPGEAHTKDESVSLDVLGRCYETYRALVEGW